MIKTRELNKKTIKISKTIELTSRYYRVRSRVLWIQLSYINHPIQALNKLFNVAYLTIEFLFDYMLFIS